MQNRPLRPVARSTFQTSVRRGFTLIEILVVIVIISMLIALLVPVLANIQQGGQVARVKNEINQLSTAIVAFKNTYGTEPPSRFRLYDDFNLYLTEDAAGPNTPEDAARLKSVQVIRRFWPRFEFNTTRDWAGDGAFTEAYTLNGSESLLFFLGGIIEPGPNLTGFSKNPVAPFSTGGSREGPFMEFSASRVKDSITESEGGNTGIPEYLDPLEGQSRPYHYMHSSSYKDHDPLEFTAPLAAALLPNVYRQNDGARTYYKPKTFQLISPGFDGLYGVSGIYEIDDTAHDGTAEHIGDEDKDNIANFAGGMLRP